MTTQPEALRLAALLNTHGHITTIERMQLDAELRRLHSLSEAMLVALQNLVDEFGDLPGLVHSERMKLHIARQAIAKATK